MCSIGDDNFDNDVDKLMPQKETVILENEKCIKCREETPCILLRSKDMYCKNCFLTATNHKFKALLGKHKLIRPNDKVLICHKFGDPSAALLHFLRSGLDLMTPKKLRFEPVLVFIEDLVKHSVEYRKELLEKIQNQVESFSFKLFLISFTDYIANDFKISLVTNHNELLINEGDNNVLNNFVEKKVKKTNRNDILHIFRRRILIDIATHLECKFVFTPEISVDIAAQLLSDVTLGRGSHVPIDTGFCDDRDPKIKILRPLRLFDMKELSTYNKFNDLEAIFVKEKDVNPYSSVQDLMQKFVTDLQVNYPATVTTIMKTGDKLAMEKNNGKVCDLCKGILLEDNEELSSAESTSFSHWVSTQKPDNNLSRQERYQTTLESFNDQKLSNYCYACSKISNFIK